MAECRQYRAVGVVIARRDYGEADRILVVLTKEKGRISFIAKGVRRPKSRKRGHLEVFSQIKFGAVQGRGLDIIIEVETLNNFSRVRKDLKKVAVGYYFCEVIGRVTRDGEKNEEIYELLIEYLGKLGKLEKLGKIRKRFVEEVLVSLGFWPKGKVMTDPDTVLEEVAERKMNSVRVGKRVLS